MKNVYFFLLLFVQSIFLQAANIPVSIQNFSFSSIPNALQVGDVITWTNNDASSHTVTSTTVPAGAASFDSGSLTSGNTFQYTIAVAGNYEYKCSFHTSMTGTFTVATATPVVKPTLTLNALYPNPAIETIHIESPKEIKSIDVYSETGAFIKTVSFSSDKIELPVGDLNKGTYLLRVVSEDGLFDTRRIIKI